MNIMNKCILFFVCLMELNAVWAQQDSADSTSSDTIPRSVKNSVSNPISKPILKSGRGIYYKAEEQIGDRKPDGQKYIRLIQNVHFEHKGTIVYCDSAHYFRKTKVLEAYGHVKIYADSVKITSDKLIYDGEARVSKLRSNVVYSSGENRLFTNFLDYDMTAKIANYFNDGKLVDSTNTLKSELGYFYELRDIVEFFHEVELQAPEYTLFADTLEYNRVTKVARTFGSTKILTKDSVVIDADEGEFRTVVDQTEFKDGQIETPDYYLEGEQLFFDDLRKVYRANGNVVMTAKNNDIIITGDHGVYDRRAGKSRVYGNPLMKRIMRRDTLFLSADTMVAIESEIEHEKKVLAYHNVKIFKQNLQGKCDSMMYQMVDSTLFLFDTPVLWSGRNQITADSINIVLVNNLLHHMNLRYNSFLVSKDTIGQFNQIKGRFMVAYFKNNSIDFVDVDGNGESIYYALSEKDNVLIGMNKILCSNMQIRLDSNKLKTITFYVNPEGEFIPPHELTDEMKTLEGFNWKQGERPQLWDVALYYKKPEDQGVIEEEIEIPDAENN